MRKIFFCFASKRVVMAQELDDGEFWLPSEFLTDDDLLTDFKTDVCLHGAENRFGFNSDLSSPVESVTGSTETESDEDDFIAGLTRKIANSTLQDSSFSSEYTTKGQRLSTSPQSTLYGCKPGSSRGSPNCVSQVSSPPDAKESVGLNFLYAAAEEVARMRTIEETSAFYSNKLYGPTLKPSQLGGQLNIPNPSPGFYPNQAHARLSYQQQLQVTHGVWAHENVGFQFQNGRRNGRGTPGSLMPSWPTLQQSEQLHQRPGTGIRAVFLEETGARKERTGTGVFLPRRIDTNITDVRRKPGKVVHALNLNLDLVDSWCPPRDNRNQSAEYGAALMHGNNIKMTQQMNNLRPPQQPVVKQEHGLPQEWTY